MPATKTKKVNNYQKLKKKKLCSQPHRTVKRTVFCSEIVSFFLTTKNIKTTDVLRFPSIELPNTRTKKLAEKISEHRVSIRS